MTDVIKLAFLVAMMIGLVWASTVFAQKDKMHMGEALGGRVIRSDGSATTKPNDPDPLHSNEAATAVTGTLKPQRLPTFHNPGNDIQTK